MTRMADIYLEMGTLLMKKPCPYLILPRQRPALLFALGLSLLGCQPEARVEVSAPEPITINLNVKIDHEIRVKVDKELDSVLSEESGLF